MSAIVTLKLCPFCTGKPIENTVTLDNGEKPKRFYVSCRSCAAEGGWSKTRTGSVRWWNMRDGHVAADETYNSDGLDKEKRSK